MAGETDECSDVDFTSPVQGLRHTQLWRMDLSPEHLGMWQAGQKSSEEGANADTCTLCEVLSAPAPGAGAQLQGITCSWWLHALCQLSQGWKNTDLTQAGCLAGIAFSKHHQPGLLCLLTWGGFYLIGTKRSCTNAAMCSLRAVCFHRSPQTP